MAVYKGREVTYLGPVSGAEFDQAMVRVQAQDGNIEHVKFSELQFTDAEKKDLTKAENSAYNSARVIKDADLRKLRDSQNAEKIEAKKD